MDFTERWSRFLSRSPEIEGGAFISGDGVLISCAKFSSDPVITRCATGVALACQLWKDVGYDALQAVILEAEQGYVVIMPVLDKAVLVVLARLRAKVGFVLLEMRAAIDSGDFGPGLAGEPIIVPQSPRRANAYARHR
jgi:predicted regulator of Ras-like GTPase activity (Roadblock/LC7/MglB family)